jgi:hypothetical protein
MTRSAMVLVTMLAGCSSSSGATTAPQPAAQPFVGTWARTGTSTTSCPGAQTTSADITGTLTIALGATGDTFVGTESVHNCTTSYTVSGNVATAAAGQSCSYANPKGLPTTSTASSHTLTLGADGKTLTLSTSGSLVIGGPDGGASTTCTTTAQGTFTKP